MNDPIAGPSEISVGGDDDPAAWRGHPLYGPFFGLLEAPFDLTPNPRFLFLTPRQREALSNLRYALAASKGFTLVLGEAGTGKTTLVRTALASIVDTPSRYVMVNNPTLGRHEFYEFLTREFNLSAGAAVSKTRFLSELQHDVEARFAAGGLTGLIVDEAQSMPYELLEEIRLLGNIETATTKLLNIVLCGQPELADRLKKIRPDLAVLYMSGYPASMLMQGAPLEASVRLIPKPFTTADLLASIEEILGSGD